MLLLSAAGPALRAAPPAMMLRDQTGAGGPNGFRFDPYGGMGQEGGRYGSVPQYGQGHNAGAKTWTVRGGWVKAPADATRDSSQDAAKAAWLARQNTAPAVDGSKPRVVSALTQYQGRVVPSRQTQPPAASGVKQQSWQTSPDVFRYGVGQVIGHDSQAWRTGGP